MQYSSLQHQTLLLSSVPSTTGCCFCFGSIPSFFLELFLHWSPVAYWAPTDLGSPSFSVLFFAFSYCSWGSQGKNTEVFVIPFSSGPHIFRPLHHDPTILGGPIRHGLVSLITHSFTCFRMEWEAGERKLVYGVTVILNWIGTIVNFENHGISQLFNVCLFIHSYWTPRRKRMTVMKTSTY